MNINIKETLLAGERVTLECKKATKGVPNSLWDTYSAFANTYGGTILLGVVEHMDEQDNTKRFEIVGVEDADKIRKDLEEGLPLISNKAYGDTPKYHFTREAAQAFACRFYLYVGGR